MSIPISNAKNRPLNVNTGTMPNVSGALQNYFQPLTFEVVEKSVESFLLVEVGEDIDFRGVMQPFGPRQLMMKPEGQRHWNWWMLHADPGLVLEVDMVVKYLDVQYRVKAQSDYRLDGYVMYELIQDFTGAGPEVEGE